MSGGLAGPGGGGRPAAALSGEDLEAAGDGGGLEAAVGA